MKVWIICLILLLAKADVVAVDNLEVVYIKPGTSRTVSLESNPTTGYSWVVESDESEYFAIENKGYEPSSSGLPGSGGLQLFEITCEASAVDGLNYQANFHYARPWEDVPLYGKALIITSTFDEDLLG